MTYTSTASVRLFTGVTGIACTALNVLEVPLYFVHDGAPPDSNVLARILIGLVVLVLFAAFVTGLRELVRRADPAYGWVADLAHAAALAYVAVTLVGSSLQAGDVIAAGEPVDPTITAEGTYLIYGAIGRLLTAAFLVAAGYATARVRLLPRWAAPAAYVLAAVNLAFVPSMFFGNDTGDFYSTNGWGTAAIVAALFSYWVLAAGVALLVRRRRRLPVHRYPDPETASGNWR